MEGCDGWKGRVCVVGPACLPAFDVANRWYIVLFLLLFSLYLSVHPSIHSFIHSFICETMSSPRVQTKTDRKSGVGHSYSLFVSVVTVFADSDTFMNESLV